MRNRGPAPESIKPATWAAASWHTREEDECDRRNRFGGKKSQNKGRQETGEGRQLLIPLGQPGEASAAKVTSVRQTKVCSVGNPASLTFCNSYLRETEIAQYSTHVKYIWQTYTNQRNKIKRAITKWMLSYKYRNNTESAKLPYTATLYYIVGKYM